jgi:hypothetical protein
MKAAVLHKVHDPMTIEDFDMPKTSADEVLIKVKACGVCHTDYRVIEGRIQSRLPAITLSFRRNQRRLSRPRSRKKLDGHYGLELVAE